MRLLHGLATALLGAGLGVQIFLSFLVAPAAFRVVDRPVAARVMEGVFPGYYGFGLATLTMALALILVLALREPGPLRWGAAALLVVTLLGTVYAGHVLLPQAHDARVRAQAAPAGDLAPMEFSRLHRLAVAVNITIFLTGALALALHLGSGVEARRARAVRATHSSDVGGSDVQPFVKTGAVECPILTDVHGGRCWSSIMSSSAWPTKPRRSASTRRSSASSSTT